MAIGSQQIERVFYVYYITLPYLHGFPYACAAACGRGRRQGRVPCPSPCGPPSPAYLSVTYDAGGGRGGLTDIGLAAGARYRVKTPTEVGIARAGYTHLGWNTRPDGSGDAYPPGVSIYLRASLTLFAKWRPHSQAQSPGLC